jgi:hypothetical protein
VGPGLLGPMVGGTAEFVAVYHAAPLF